MNDLFAISAYHLKPAIDNFRIHPVIGDAMEPLLRGGRDFVLTAPVTTYQGEGIYLIDAGLGIELVQVVNTMDAEGKLCLSRENSRYQSRYVQREKFNEMVVGIVVADIRTRNERFLTRT
ncbi:hypothetical protein [Rhizobium sp. AG207R]|uniref:hypothetical protein n=1 Tax=Rhizobium sp. AG207R TaxID=2802287 RepID=UPI0022AC0BC4|nr:hypothetical protein [Rhizobium sp. AG207R]MCZ3377462.1 hypothetical protein [Rhizobium sp. AG207R]